MLTIFAVPKAFKGHFAVIQENAIESWTKLKPRPEIIIFGDEDGIEKVAKKYRIKLIKKIRKNKFGTPILSDVFNRAANISKNPTLAYVNSDIILLHDFTERLKQITLKRFLVIGNRWDLDISVRIKFNNQLEQKLLSKIKGKKFGSRQPLDFFVFPKSLDLKMPPFAIGRTLWDNWIVFRAKCLKVPVIDASYTISAFHQNHDYSHAGDYETVSIGPEAIANRQLAGDLIYSRFNLINSDFILTDQGLKKPYFTVQRLWRRFQAFPITRRNFRFLLPLILLLTYFLKIYKKLIFVIFK